MSFSKDFTLTIPFYSQNCKENKTTHSISFGDMANVFSSLGYIRI
jgi:hypothetical protein